MSLGLVEEAIMVRVMVAVVAVVVAIDGVGRLVEQY